MRGREVWVHAVDLDTGCGFADVPREVCAALVDDVAAGFRARTDFPPVELRAEGAVAPGSSVCPAVPARSW
ncbi:DinB family protein [Streptomyces hawaiiensis]|uniref:hypothetical protein n=1 Tax=Streptomyces hawaiiensis TaxID=67305 RepID=UPI0036528CDD